MYRVRGLGEHRGGMQDIDLPVAQIFRRPEVLPDGRGIRVRGVDARHDSATRLTGIDEAQANLLGGDGMPWHCMVGEQCGELAAITRDPGADRGMFTANWQTLLPQAMQKRKRAIHGFGDAMNVHETEPAVKWHAGEIDFLEDVREGPEAVPVDQMLQSHDDVGGARRRKRFVMQRVPRLRGDVPLGVVEGTGLRMTSCFFSAPQHDIARCVFELGDRVGADISKRIGGVIMGTDKVGSEAVAVAEFEKVGDPCVLRRGWTANLERRVDAFDRIDRVPIEIEVRGLICRPESAEIRLIPDFERPLSDFPNAITVDPVTHELADQCAPLHVILGMVYVASIVKDRRIAGRKYQRHEAQLDERLHPDGEEEIDNAISVEKGIEELVVVPNERAHVVAQQPMKTHVPETQLQMGTCEVLLPVSSQGERCVAAANRVLPRVSERDGGARTITLKFENHRKPLPSSKHVPSVPARRARQPIDPALRSTVRGVFY